MGYWKGTLTKSVINFPGTKFARDQVMHLRYIPHVRSVLPEYWAKLKKKNKNQVCKYCVLFFNHCCVFRQKSLLFLKCRLYKNIREWGIVLSDNSCYTSIDHFQNKNFIDFLSCLPAVELLYFPALFRQSNISNSFNHVTVVI